MRISDWSSDVFSSDLQRQTLYDQVRCDRIINIRMFVKQDGQAAGRDRARWAPDFRPQLCNKPFHHTHIAPEHTNMHLVLCSPPNPRLASWRFVGAAGQYERAACGEMRGQDVAK